MSQSAAGASVQGSVQTLSAPSVLSEASSAQHQATSQRAEWSQLYDARDLERTELRVLREEGEQLSKLLKKIAPNDARDTWTYTDLEGAVNEARLKWKDKTRLGGGKAQQFFHNLMGKFDSHSGLFAIIPTEDRYLSVLTGGITILVKASTSHSKTIEQLNDALEQISELVALCDTESRLIRSEMMQNAVAKLYIAIFLFLGDAIKWYNSSSTSKVLNSLHNDFSEGFRSAVDRVRKMASQVQRIASLGSAAETRVIRLDLEELQEELHDARIGLSGQLRFIAEMIRVQQGDNLEQHRRTQQLLRESEAARLLSSSPSPSPAPSLLDARQDPQLLLPSTSSLPLPLSSSSSSHVRPSASEPMDGFESHTSAISGNTVSTQDTPSLRALVRRLYTERKLDQTSAAAATQVATANLYSINIASPINSWLAATNKPLLYLEFPANTVQSTPYYMATNIVRTCQSAGVECISYYPNKAKRFFADDDAAAASTTSSSSSTESPLIDMLLSLAHQILSLTPSTEANLAAATSPIAGLPEAVTTTTDAFSVFEAVVRSTPPQTKIYIIIDAVSTFSHNSTARVNSDDSSSSSNKDIRRFLSVIRDQAPAVSSSSSHASLKVIMLSHRRAHNLMSQLNASEISIVSAPPTRSRPVMVPIVLR